MSAAFTKFMVRGGKVSGRGDLALQLGYGWLQHYGMVARSDSFFPSVLFIHDNADNAKYQAEDKVKSLEKSIMLLTKEKDAEILELQLEKARLQGHVTSIEKVIA
ncbi:hypothetical protein AgCh_015015 [Apium graveolens]